MGGAPDTELSEGDPGDDTARRFAFQYTYAAVLACSLLDAMTGISELFCEHHEDVLLKHDDGTFSGVQVKTRQLGGDPFKASDREVLSAFTRFVSLERRFPGRFRAFVLATSHSFWTGKKNRADLPHLLSLASSAQDEHACDPILIPLMTKLARLSESPLSVVLATLKKCRCDHSLPKLDGSKKELIGTLSETWRRASEPSYPMLEKAADDLVAECGRASSLDHAQCLPGYLSVLPIGAEAAIRAAIAGKRFDRARVEALLENAAQAPALLVGPETPALTSVDSSTARLERKLQAGGLSAVSITSAKDLRNKADYLALQWLSRFGEKPGLQRRDHIRSIVLRDCADAYEAAKDSPKPFGFRMHEELRERIRKRRRDAPATVLDCLDEHLEGYAYVLTGECTVIWSDAMPPGGDA